MMDVSSIVGMNDVVAQAPGYLLRRVQKLVATRAEACFQDSRLSFTQWIALRLVQDRIVDTAGAMARNMCHDTGAVTRVLDQLEEQDMLRRTRSRQDRRVVTLAVTPKGEAAVAEMRPGIDALWSDLFAGFTPQEITLFTTILSKMLMRLEAGESQAGDEG